MNQIYDIVTLIGQILDGGLCRMTDGVKGVALCHDDGCQLVKVTRFVSLDSISNALLHEIRLTDFHFRTRCNAAIHTLGAADRLDGVRNDAYADAKRAPVGFVHNLVLRIRKSVQ